MEGEFYYEPSIWPFFITPTLLISLLSSLLIPYLVSPPFWSLFLSSKNPPRSNMHFHTVLTSTIHAFVSVVLALYLLFSGEVNSNHAFSKSHLGFVTIQLSLGFFIGDCIVNLLDPKLRADRGGMIHHAAAIGGLVFCLYYQGLFMFFVVYRLITECSQPFVNVRYVLHELECIDGMLYTCASVAMWVVFILCRIVVIPLHWYVIVTTVATEETFLLVPPLFRVGLVCNYLVFDFLNVCWCYTMMNKCTPKHFKPKKELIELA